MSDQTLNAQSDHKWYKLPRPLFSEKRNIGLRVPRTATTYACRAEFPENVFEFLELLPHAHVFGFQMGLEYFEEADFFPAMDTYLEIIIGTLKLWEVRGLLVGGRDLHVMAQTIQPVEKYTGERCDYEDVWADYQRLWAKRPKWLEMQKLYREDADGPDTYGVLLHRHARFGPMGVDQETLKALGLSEAWAMVGIDGEAS